MKAIGWAGKTLEQVSMNSEPDFFTLFSILFYFFFNRHWKVACSCNRCSEIYILYFKHYQEFAFSSNKS